VELSWNPSADNTDVAGYHIFRDGAAFASISATQYVDRDLADAITYDYTVAAFDHAGNVSAQSASVSAGKAVKGGGKGGGGGGKGKQK
jgi:cellulose 1,4-beta-cellobiosidase